jgi:hypothetical protein
MGQQQQQMPGLQQQPPSMGGVGSMGGLAPVSAPPASYGGAAAAPDVVLSPTNPFASVPAGPAAVPVATGGVGVGANPFGGSNVDQEWNAFFARCAHLAPVSTVAAASVAAAIVLAVIASGVVRSGTPCKLCHFRWDMLLTELRHAPHSNLSLLLLLLLLLVVLLNFAGVRQLASEGSSNSKVTTSRLSGCVDGASCWHSSAAAAWDTGMTVLSSSSSSSNN